jgi:hypothetical protein
MFLQRITLENIRAIEHLELSFTSQDGSPRKWTLLLGENGSGKSTILRAIALILAGSEALPELLGKPDAWIRFKKKECAIHADLVTAEGEKRAIDLRLRRSDGIKEVFERNKKTLDAIDSAIRHSARNYMTIGYGVSRRLSSEKSLASVQGNVFRHPRAQSVGTLFSPDASLNPLESWAMDLDYRRKGEGLKIVKSGLRGLLPGVEFSRIDKRGHQLMFRTPDGEIPLPLLSDGYQNVAAWCGDLLYRITETFADHKKPLSARGLLLIDEVDLHLHPIWKRQLIDFLNEKLPNFQIVATTHSALTVHQAGEGELFVLKRDTPNSAPLLIPYLGEPRHLLLHQLLMSPLFGLETADSRPVEKLKNEYKALESKPGLSAVQKSRVETLKTELADVPEWDKRTPEEIKQSGLLAKIDHALNSENDAAKRTMRKRSAKKSRRAKTSRK